MKKLLAYLETDGDRPDVLDHEDGVVAVSAQGEGTVKLVGIVEVVRRVVSVKDGAEGKGKKGEGSEKWWMYTTLGCVEGERRRRVGGIAEEDGEEREVELKKIPVLTVWMMRRSLPIWKRVLGEQDFCVRRLVREED